MLVGDSPHVHLVTKMSWLDFEVKRHFGNFEDMGSKITTFPAKVY